MPTHYLCLPKKIPGLRPWTLKITLSSISPLCVTSHKEKKSDFLIFLTFLLFRTKYILSITMRPMKLQIRVHKFFRLQVSKYYHKS